MTDFALRQQLGERPDAPARAYRLLPAPTSVGVVAALVVLGAAGWAYTIREADRMSGMGMVMGLGEIGEGMGMAMSVPSFLGMWAAMMVAMMAPTLAPVALAHRATVGDGGKGAILTAAFVVGFLVVWVATGLVALVPYRLLLEIPAREGGSRWLAALAGAVLVGVGVFQFTPWKVHCLRRCRTPLAAIRGVGPGRGFARSLRTGAEHGGRCLGCCWAFMVVLLVVGIMNLAWMAVIAAIFLLDKHWAHGEGLTRVAGTVFVVLGLAVIAFPDLLAYISGTNVDRPMEPGHMGDMPM